MITRRDLLIATIAVSATLSAIAVAQDSKPLMKSSVFDWNGVESKATKTGSRREFFKQPTATLDQLECHVTTINPGESAHAPHQHPEEELVVIKDGTVEVMQNGSLKRIGAGSLVFQGSNDLHGMKNVGQTPASYYVIKWYSPGALKPKS